jgi:hypothetical protein
MEDTQSVEVGDVEQRALEVLRRAVLVDFALLVDDPHVHAYLWAHFPEPDPDQQASLHRWGRAAEINRQIYGRPTDAEAAETQLSRRKRLPADWDLTMQEATLKLADDEFFTFMQRHPTTFVNRNATRVIQRTYVIYNVLRSTEASMADDV